MGGAQCTCSNDDTTVAQTLIEPHDA